MENIKVINFLKNRIGNKKGSYIVEAAITLPIFIIAVIAMILIVNIISSCESIVFNSSVELKDLAVESYFYDGFNFILEDKIKEDNKNVDFNITNLDMNQRNEEIHFNSSADFNVNNGIGIGGEINFDLGIIARKYVGNSLDINPLGLEYFTSNSDSSIVIVFPRYGIRYHKENCKYVSIYGTDERYMEYLERNDAKLKGYTRCNVCYNGEFNE